jgi:N-formylglutamate deformylase
MTAPIFKLVAGDSPLLISIPHLGTHIPDEFRASMTPEALPVCDTDWHLDRLYDFALQDGASMLSAQVSRYVIDLNRPPDGASLYPGQTTTGLCPSETFHGQPVYLAGREPDAAEVQRRVAAYWVPYHRALAEQIAAIKARHGFVVLWEAHSIASELPHLFEGVLPDLNFGTFGGRSSALSVGAAVAELAAQHPYTWVLNGRFKGGYITRQYGDPKNGVHAIQLEMSQKVYMDEALPFNYRPDLADGVRPVLASMLDAVVEAARSSELSSNRGVLS